MSIEQLKELLKEVNKDKEFWNEYAATYWNFYDSLINAGFTKEQTMEIISRQGSGVKPNS